ncbi:hypothetical protein FSP39_010322 [Pinctada imbricata]|uniref:Uncharacterized protein n=1 Tax=Pinctada imbricata TaxID=66713 RepID=A0AA88XFA4_PINIB|nr:hypothetical protein FSP39_010322 [Pinctada imbricata]
MAGVLGTWESDKSVAAQNVDGFMEAMGMAQRIAHMKDAFTKMTISRDGHNWTIYIESNRLPAPKTYNIKMGEEFDDVGMDGDTMKVVVNMEGDNKMVEKRDITRKNNPSAPPVQTIVTREVHGDVMKVTMTCKDQSMVYQMKRS